MRLRLVSHWMLVAVALAALALACGRADKAPSGPSPETTVTPEAAPGGDSDPAGGQDHAQRGRMEDGMFVAQGAPAPRACTTSSECIADTVPAAGGCCQAYQIVPHARSYRAWITQWRASNCAAVTCPPPPAPARPAACSIHVRCAESVCADFCASNAPADAFVLTIDLTRGERSKDSGFTHRTVGVIGHSYFVEERYGGTTSRRGAGFEATGELTDEQLAAMTALVRDNNLLEAASISERDHADGPHGYVRAHVTLRLDGADHAFSITGVTSADGASTPVRDSTALRAVERLAASVGTR